MKHSEKNAKKTVSPRAQTQIRQKFLNKRKYNSPKIPFNALFHLTIVKWSKHLPQRTKIHPKSHDLTLEG